MAFDVRCIRRNPLGVKSRRSLRSEPEPLIHFDKFAASDPPNVGMRCHDQSFADKNHPDIFDVMSTCRMQKYAKMGSQPDFRRLSQLHAVQLTGLSKPGQRKPQRSEASSCSHLYTFTAFRAFHLLAAFGVLPNWKLLSTHFWIDVKTISRNETNSPLGVWTTCWWHKSNLKTVGCRTNCNLLHNTAWP